MHDANDYALHEFSAEKFDDYELVAKLQSRAEFFYEGSWILRGVPRPVLVGWFCEEGTHNRA
jgi:hypothetical protein